MSRPVQIKDRVTLLVYLPRKTRKAIQKQADSEGISASAVARRSLVREFGGEKK